MPPRSFGVAGHLPVINHTPSLSTSTVWRPATVARDFVQDHASATIDSVPNINSWSKNVDPAAANRSDRSLAPSVASEVDDTTFRALYPSH